MSGVVLPLDNRRTVDDSMGRAVDPTEVGPNLQAPPAGPDSFDLRNLTLTTTLAG
ncbi:MAG: hypothetical protein ACLP5O_16510 [Acidimicrobiales bacterium]